jgi:hypothetical protein
MPQRDLVGARHELDRAKVFMYVTMQFLLAHEAASQRESLPLKSFWDAGGPPSQTGV